MKETARLLNNDIEVDVRKFLDGKLLLQANTGGGKSHAIRRICEQLFDVVPIIILDTEGEFSTLRQKYNFILIGKGQRITADYKSAALLAHKIIEERVSVVIDLFEQTPYEREMFVKNFVQAMTNAPKALWLPTLLIVDEAQTYAPEGDKTECGRTLHDAAFKFRKRHFGIVFATPRIAVLSKNVSSTCRNKLIGYTSEPNDVKRAAYELGFVGKDEWRSLRDLDPGQFFAFGPSFSKEVIKVQIGEVKTQHGDDGHDVMTAVKPTEKIKKALEVLSLVPQEAEEELRTSADLKNALAQARRKITELERYGTDPKGVSEWIAIGKKYKYWEFSIDKEVKMILGTMENSYKSSVDEWKRYSLKLRELFVNIQEDYKNALSIMSVPQKKPGVSYVPVAAPYVPIVKGSENMMSELEPIPSMGDGERKILIAIASMPDGVTREFITVQTGYKTSTRNAYIQRLLQKEFIKLSHLDYTDPIINVTLSGIEALGSDYQPLPKGLELRKHYLQTLPDGEAKILHALIEQHNLTREQISSYTGFKPSTRNAYIQRLRVRKLIDLQGDLLKASDHLYD